MTDRLLERPSTGPREGRLGGRHRRRRAPAHPSGLRRWRLRTRLADLFPGLFGMSRQAAWRRFVIRRGAALVLITLGVAVAFSAGVLSAATR